VDIQAIVDAAGLFGGNYLATVIVNSNDPVTPELRAPRVSLTITGVPVLTVTPNPVVFDSTFVSTTSDQLVTVGNSGTDTLTITNITSTEAVFTVDTTNLVLGSLESYDITVSFDPLQPQVYTGWLVFESNAPTSPDSITISGEAVEAPVISVNPTEISQTVTQNDSVDVPMTIANVAAAGTGSDLIWSATLQMVTENLPVGNFPNEMVFDLPFAKLVGDTNGVVPAGSNMGFIVRLFGVGGDTTWQANCVISSNDPATPEVVVPVTDSVVTVVGIEDLTALPTTFDISQNYPNPFNPTTTISYQVPQSTEVRLVIYNTLGQKVRTLVNSRMEPGYHSVVWDGRSENGRTVASGIYIYRFEASDFTKTLKLMLLK
jgi:hypothetical protein